jgi:hypothetical protein
MRNTVLSILIPILAGCASHEIPEETAQNILKVYFGNYQRLEPCYKAYGKSEPVKVGVEITVGSSGEVQFANVDHENAEIPYHSNPEFDRCATETIQRLSFASFAMTDSRGFRVTLPVVFPVK